MDKNYWIYEDSFIFKPEFNEPIDDYIDIIKNYKKLIFSNYNDFKICIETNNNYINKYQNNYIDSKFNQLPIKFYKKFYGAPENKLKFIFLGDHYQIH